MNQSLQYSRSEKNTPLCFHDKLSHSVWHLFFYVVMSIDFHWCQTKAIMHYKCIKIWMDSIKCNLDVTFLSGQKNTKLFLILSAARLSILACCTTTYFTIVIMETAVYFFFWEPVSCVIRTLDEFVREWSPSVCILVMNGQQSVLLE